MGAGTGRLFQYDIKEKVHELTGVDLDPRVEDNPLLDQGIVGDLYNLPFEDSHFDVAFCRYVLEHVDRPTDFASEIHRVLRPGGCFVFLTPNRWHYVTVISRITPPSFHTWLNRRRGRDDADTFPTRYLLNSSRQLERHFASAGFVRESLTYRECCPNYLKFSRPLFLLGVLYERTVNRFEILRFLRVNLVGTFRKEGVAN